jgi:hypothetical protein
VTEPALLSICMVAVFALMAGGVLTITKRRNRTQGALMIVAALVLFGNVLIWAWPIRP